MLSVSFFVGSFATPFELRCACDVSIWLMTAHASISPFPRGAQPDSLAYSSTIFFFARSSTSSSIVSLLTNR